MARNKKALSAQRIGNCITDARNKQALAERQRSAATARAAAAESDNEALRREVAALRASAA